MQHRVGQQEHQAGVDGRGLEHIHILPLRVEHQGIDGVKQRHKEDLQKDPNGIAPHGNSVLLSPMKHDDAAQDHHQDTCQDDQAGEDKEFELGDVIPRGGAKGLIDVDKNQRKKGCPQNKLHDMLLIVDVSWYIFIPHAHALNLH